MKSIELAAFADYWGGKPGLDSVTVKDIEDNNKRAMALQSKDVDVIQKVDSANRSFVQRRFQYSRRCWRSCVYVESKQHRSISIT